MEKKVRTSLVHSCEHWSVSILVHNAVGSESIRTLYVVIGTLDWPSTMGQRTSTPRFESLSADSEMDGGNLPLPSVQFHPLHGSNLSRSNDGTIVYRPFRFFGSKCHSLAFSNRPIIASEMLSIQVHNLSVLVGFVSNSPERIMSAGLPRCSRQLDMEFSMYIPKKQMQSIAFGYDTFGNVIYSVDGHERGIFYNRIHSDQDVWAVIDMVSCTTDCYFTTVHLILNFISIGSACQQQAPQEQRSQSGN